MPVSLTIKGADKLRTMARKLREASNVELPRELQKAIREASKPTLRAIQESARHINTKGIPKPGAKHSFRGPSASKGLRQKIAEAVVADVQTGGDDPRVQFRVSQAKLPDNIKQMPRKFDAGGTFRHPVMGNREVWVSQTGDPWFWPPIRDHIRDFRAEIDKALDNVARKLEE